MDLPRVAAGRVWQLSRDIHHGSDSSNSSFRTRLIIYCRTTMSARFCTWRKVRVGGWVASGVASQSVGEVRGER